jgi:2-polyprenyl-3-methyl-5-hydroxy-6-metoxy-1,4-benzoquinol methylase
MDATYEPDFYDLVNPESFRGDAEWYRQKAKECGSPILELGAGTGRITLAIAKDGATIHAARSPKMGTSWSSRPPASEESA